jgi:hypothetical protein
VKGSFLLETNRNTTTTTTTLIAGKKQTHSTGIRIDHLKRPRHLASGTTGLEWAGLRWRHVGPKRESPVRSISPTAQHPRQYQQLHRHWARNFLSRRNASRHSKWWYRARKGTPKDTLYGYHSWEGCPYPYHIGSDRELGIPMETTLGREAVLSIQTKTRRAIYRTATHMIAIRVNNIRSAALGLIEFSTGVPYRTPLRHPIVSWIITHTSHRWHRNALVWSSICDPLDYTPCWRQHARSHIDHPKNDGENRSTHTTHPAAV